MRILLTGAAGFIGMHVAQALLQRGDQVVGVDNLNDYYDPGLKRSRLARLQAHAGFTFQLQDIAGARGLQQVFAQTEPERVVHLAAQAGVRYSIDNPDAFVQSNLVGFGNMLECCRAHRVSHLVYASSSSVYGGNTQLPLSEHHNVDHPLSLYGATKKANELMAHSYSHLFGIPTSGLRFFTVYGPWGRPDMALFKFTKAILADEPIDVYNHGKMVRDFTYIDDIAQGVVAVLDQPAMPDPGFDAAAPDPASSFAPYRVLNIGNQQPVELVDYIDAIEQALGKRAIRNLMPMQLGDMASTFSDTRRLAALTGVSQSTPVGEGVRKFIDWYLGYYGADKRNP
ncbi:MAG: NAD-dependent epimerase [Burkholderiaceae bacterium]|nr:NAD-dependent epimerase [Burkholderiaceae bacterium]MDO9090185.1 NAD-dependent epimerase [Burkholderiaceae bacterium]